MAPETSQEDSGSTSSDPSLLTALEDTGVPPCVQLQLPSHNSDPCASSCTRCTSSDWFVSGIELLMTSNEKLPSDKKSKQPPPLKQQPNCPMKQQAQESETTSDGALQRTRSQGTKGFSSKEAEKDGLPNDDSESVENTNQHINDGNTTGDTKQLIKNDAKADEGTNQIVNDGRTLRSTKQQTPKSDTASDEALQRTRAGQQCSEKAGKESADATIQSANIYAGCKQTSKDEESRAGSVVNATEGSAFPQSEKMSNNAATKTKQAALSQAASSSNEADKIGLPVNYEKTAGNSKQPAKEDAKFNEDAKKPANDGNSGTDQAASDSAEDSGKLAESSLGSAQTQSSFELDTATSDSLLELDCSDLEESETPETAEIESEISMLRRKSLMSTNDDGTTGNKTQRKSDGKSIEQENVTDSDDLKSDARSLCEPKPNLTHAEMSEMQRSSTFGAGALDARWRSNSKDTSNAKQTSGQPAAEDGKVAKQSSSYSAQDSGPSPTSARVASPYELETATSDSVKMKHPVKHSSIRNLQHFIIIASEPERFKLRKIGSVSVPPPLGESRVIWNVEIPENFQNDCPVRPASSPDESRVRAEPSPSSAHMTPSYYVDAATSDTLELEHPVKQAFEQSKSAALEPESSRLRQKRSVFAPSPLGDSRTNGQVQILEKFQTDPTVHPASSTSLSDSAKSDAESLKGNKDNAQQVAFCSLGTKPAATEAQSDLSCTLRKKACQIVSVPASALPQLQPHLASAPADSKLPKSRSETSGAPNSNMRQTLLGISKLKHQLDASCPLHTQTAKRVLELFELLEYILTQRMLQNSSSDTTVTASAVSATVTTSVARAVASGFTSEVSSGSKLQLCRKSGTHGCSPEAGGGRGIQRE